MIIPECNNFLSFKQFILDFYNANHNKNSPLEIVIKSLAKKRKNGLFLELGVWKGGTISMVHENVPDWDIYGFDSFEGLPENWIPGFNAKAFDLQGNMPSLHKDIKLIKGWFNETLPAWLNMNKKRMIDVLHIDCDLYSSTKTAFNNLGRLVSGGSVIVFDEFLNYPGYENHEMLAFYEFMIEHKKFGYDYHVLCCGGYNNQQLAISCGGLDLTY